MRLTIALPLLLLLFPTALFAQRAEPGDVVPDVTFPTFLHGDGRQRLSEFRGQVVVVVTFADVYGGMSAAQRAIKLHRDLAKHGLVVVMAHVQAGGTRGSGSAGKDLAVWSLNRCPGWDARMCEGVNAPWNWHGKGTPPLYAVIGADGRLVAAGSIRSNPKQLDKSVHAALKQLKKGWGDKGEARVRALIYGRRQLGKAHVVAEGGMVREVADVYARQKGVVQWLLDQGQWLRAEREARGLAKAVSGMAEWETEVAELIGRFDTPDGRRELALDKKLSKLLSPLKKKGPRKGADRPLRRFSEKATGTAVGKRAAVLAERVARAAGT